MQFRSLAVLAVASTIVALTPGAARAQDDRLSIHGSANIGYGKTDGLPYFGLNQDGTSDYRAVALQFGYKVSDNDRVVTQLLHRKFGTSPLNAITPDIEPIWAFVEHRFDNGFTVKAGRNPLPRGLFNEVRFIGTLLPFYRVGNAVYGETLENIDGVVVRKPFQLGGGWSLDSYLFGGGYDLKAQIPTSTGNAVIKIRNENSIGAQLWLSTPIKGVRVGSFVQSYKSTPSAALPEAQRPSRTVTALYSAEGVFSKAFVRGELTTFDGKDNSYVKFKSYYAQAGITPTEKVTLAVEYDGGNNNISFAPAPLPNLDLPLNKEFALGVTYKPSASVAFKLEGHKVDGYSFDRPVPSVIAPTAPPFVATLAPTSKGYFGLMSVAFSF
jgi:hypothetical protein